ncbi:hypothetical protein [Atlantibacter hermannii]|uniref:hypothetical protein n=1 Tax=Atlantibacter hermannii TaxID=565 RepID=UPI00289F4B86|nr:hypothetical protein [Atlantibacter hermannii]
MHRIDTSTALKDKFGVGKNGFTRGNPQTGTPATDLDDDFFDMLQEELVGVVEAAGLALDKTKHDQLRMALPLFLGLKEAAKRAVGTGVNQIPDMSAYELVGNLTAGYLKLPNGFKLQWLETPAKLAANSTGAGYWTYPFSVCWFAIAVPVAVTPAAAAGNVVAGAFSYAAVELHNWGQIPAAARIIGFGR